MTPPEEHISNNQRRHDLFKMTWPMLIGVLSLMSFQLVDSIFISRLGIEPLAVIGFTIPIYQVIIGIQVGIGIATTAMISQRLGAGKEERASELGTRILILGGSAIALLCALIWLFRAQILEALGGSPTLLPLLEELWSIWLLAAFTGAFVYFGYSICRAHGDTLLPGVGMVLTSLLNIAFDPFFIFYLDLGLVGAAYATLCAFFAGGLLIYPKIIKRHWIRWRSNSTISMFQDSKEITGIATPAMTSQLMPSLAAMLTTAIVAQYGTEAVAAWGLGVRLEFFSIVLVLALTMSMPPMIGRYYGSGNDSEISKLIALSIKVVLVWQTLLAIFMLSFAQPLSFLLAGQAEVVEIVQFYLYALPISYGPMGVCILMVSFSNAISQAFRAMLISFLRLFACYVPCLYIGGTIAGLEGLMIGAMIGNFIAGYMAWQLFQRGFKQLDHSEAASRVV